MFFSKWKNKEINEKINDTIFWFRILLIFSCINAVLSIFELIIN